MRDYKEYEVWTKANALVLFIYNKVTPDFPKSEQFELSRQMRRAAYAIPFNIVEGCSKNSDKDFAHFLDLSLGSAHELEQGLLLAKDRRYITEKMFNTVSEKINEIKARIINLIKLMSVSPNI